MKSRFTCVLLSGLVSSAISIAQPLSKPPLSAQFDHLLKKQFQPGGPGCTALIVQKGKIIYQKAIGMANLELSVPMRLNMVFRIGSMTKQFTAMAILQLMEQGQLSLQDEITRFIPDYPTQGKKITIEQLLTHTSGIKDYTSMREFTTIAKNDLTPPQLIEFFKNQPLDFEPGTQWAYSNSGYFLPGYIIEKVSGKSYPDYLTNVFFKPLNMNNSYYGSTSRLIKNRAAGYQFGKGGEVQNADDLSMSLPYAAGAIQSTVADLWRWHRAVHNYRLVKKETLNRAFTRYKLLDGQVTNYGYGWFLDTLKGSVTIEHGGSINGFLTDGIYLPQEDIFVVVLLNSTANAPCEVAELLAATAIGKYKNEPKFVVETAHLQAYVGSYEGSYAGQAFGTSQITLLDNQLYWQEEGGEKVKLIPYQKDRFRVKDSLNTLFIVRDGTGQPAYIRYQRRLWLTDWKRVPKPKSTGN